MTEDPSLVRLRLRDTTVAEYVVTPDIDPRWSPRPYLHPVRTLSGVPVTDTLPEDHRWHLGVSVAMQDVAGNNLWGGRTYVRDAGYTWLDDHGRIVHDTWHDRRPDGFGQRLRWLDHAGATLLTEERVVAVRELAPAAPGTPGGGLSGAYALEIGYTLTAPTDRDIPLGSPATNGRPDGAGYGGFFWRAAPGAEHTFTADSDGEEKVNGSTEPWVALTGHGADGAPYTLVFAGLGDGDHWFVRTGIYPGVCVALAFERPLLVPAGGAVARRHRIVVADGILSRNEVAELAPRLAE